MTARPSAASLRRRKRVFSTLESLESRTLFSVISVTDFGATPNDGSDDSAAIQAAINSSNPGDTILFPSGTFNISGLKPLLGNRTYQGQNGAVLQGRTNAGQMLNIHTDNITITGLTFNGGGIFIDKSGGFNQNIVINNNVFQLNTSGANPNGITFTSGLANSTITNNLFTNYTGTFGIYGYNYNGLTIANNEFVNVTAGIHIDAFGGSGNLLVEQNYLTGIRGMGMEFQTQGGKGNPATAMNLTFQDNWYENPNLSSNPANNKNSMAFSLILDKGSNITIQRNVVIAPQRPDGIGTRIGFEVGGDNTLVQDNYVNGVNQVLAVNDGDGSTSVTVKNNQFMNYLQGPGITFPSPTRTWQNINNGPNVTLTWSISRGRPMRNQRYAGTGNSLSANNSTSTPTTSTPTTSTPAPTTTVTPPAPTPTTPTPTPPPKTTTPAPPTKTTIPTSGPIIAPSKPLPVLSTPTQLTATSVNGNQVNLTWQDTNTQETGYKIERSWDGVTWSQIAIVGANATKFSNTGLTVGLHVFYRVRAYYSTATSAYSNVSDVTVNNIVTPTYPAPVLPPGTTTVPSPSPTAPSPTGGRSPTLPTYSPVAVGTVAASPSRIA